jgi:nucleoside-diphosphate-sugar epimerase
MSSVTVFVTGATGTLGKPVVQRLVAGGHRVRALAHNESSIERIRALGAEPLRADLFDRVSLTEAVAGVDAILHLATRIPSAARSARLDAWRENDRIRREGTRNLVDAAIHNGIGVVVYPSFGFVYPDSGDDWIDAATRQPAQPPHPFVQSTLDAEAELTRYDAAGGRGVVLRMGGFYGPTTTHTLEMRAMARRGLSPLPGPDDGFVPTIWVDDAASAVVAALSPEVPAGTYDVVDDEPLHRGEAVQAIATTVGRRRLLRIPSWVLNLVSPASAGLFSLSLRISNERFKRVSGWSPSMRNARVGWQHLGTTWGTPPTARSGRSLALTAALLFLFLQAVIGGLWIMLSPASFFSDFPGFGHTWVSLDGPYNEHLLRDFGSLNLALSVVLLFALVRPQPRLVSAASLAVLAGTLPHFAYHLLHLDILPTDGDRVLQTVLLGLIPIVALWILSCVWLRPPLARDVVSEATRLQSEVHAKHSGTRRFHETVQQQRQSEIAKLGQKPV